MKYPKWKNKYSRFNKKFTEEVRNSAAYKKYRKKHDIKVEKWLNKNSIFSVTTLMKHPKDIFNIESIEPEAIHCVFCLIAEGSKYTRTVGFYFNFKDAERCVITNNLDIYENGYYPYAVIERMSQGLYPSSQQHKHWWYKWNKEKDGYELIKQPEGIPEDFRILDIG